MSFQSGSLIVPSVEITWPSFDLLKFPPASEPQTLRPPVSDFSLARPFNIDSKLYNDALHALVPISIATVYAVIANYVNNVNKRRENKPWAISRSSIFYGFVLLHNVSLAAFSAWTFIGMLNAIANSWPGLSGERGFARAVDSLCKIHGPRGYGSAATFNPKSTSWGFTDTVMKLKESLPDTTDVGRLWNEGLAFYGWLFYISKFYEVIDTAIVLAKGKNTAFFQTYHHAGAMMCMWAGIRYMSPPIWMFVLINSGIHALMYTYYTLNHLTVPVPRSLKQTLTTLQIVQFVFGASYAMAHLFIAYDIPVEVPFTFVSRLSTAIPRASAFSALSSATAKGSVTDWLKKAALRAAGEEGLAENVRNSDGETFGIDAAHAEEAENLIEEVRYKMQYQRIGCLDTSGEAFAILLNCFYLAPLTFMFFKFFAQKYLKKAKSSSPPPLKENIQVSSQEAARDIKKEIQEAMDSNQNDLQANSSDVPSKLMAKLDNAKEAGASVREKARETASQANDVLQDKIQAGTDIASEKVNELNKQFKGSKEDSRANGTTQDDVSKSDEGREPENTEESSHKSVKLDGFKKPDLPKPNKSQSRPQSPKKSELPRPKKSENRQSSPEKKGEPVKNQTNDISDSKKDESKDETNNHLAEENKSSLDESAYEVNPDELKNEKEKEAEKEMQPGSS